MPQVIYDLRAFEEPYTNKGGINAQKFRKFFDKTKFLRKMCFPFKEIDKNPDDYNHQILNEVKGKWWLKTLILGYMNDPHDENEFEHV